MAQYTLTQYVGGDLGTKHTKLRRVDESSIKAPTTTSKNRLTTSEDMWMG